MGEFQFHPDLGTEQIVQFLAGRAGEAVRAVPFARVTVNILKYTVTVFQVIMATRLPKLIAFDLECVTNSQPRFDF
jgi:hypothetical protein